MQILKPIFFIGFPRSGTTVAFEAFCQHRTLGWPSVYTERFPTHPGINVVIMEALGMGRPVISTYVAGIPELVRPGENGWLVTAGNVDELVSAIREALDAPAAQLTSMGRAGRERVRARHHVTTEVETLETLLRAAASGVANS